MTLEKYIKELAPINTIEKVDRLLLFIKTNKLFFDENMDYEIRLAIKKLSVQMYYADNRPDFGRRHISSKKVFHQRKCTVGSKTRLQIALLKEILNDNGKGKKNKRKGERVDRILNSVAEKKTKNEEIIEKKKRNDRNYAAIENESISGRYHVPDWALRKLAKNGRDYSYRHPTIAGAIRNAANRTKEQQEDFDWKKKPHIIYTPMGGQNKKY